MDDVSTSLLVATIIVAGVAFIALFVFCCVNVSKERKRIHDELSGKAGVFDGPAGEPWWNGKLPVEVNDYIRPRYVYENLVEAETYQPDNGRIVGYRISPKLVIHSCVRQIKPSLVAKYRDRLGGKLLEFSDVRVLATSWKEISELRVAAGDKPLDVKSVYATCCGTLVICNVENMMWDYPSDLATLENYLLILKR